MSPSSPPAGYVLRDPEGSLAKRITLVAVVVPAVIGFVSLLAGLGWGLLSGVVAIGFVLLVGQHSLRAALAWHAPQLQTPAAGLALGSTSTITYRRRPKRPTDVGNFAAVANLVCTEKATYSSGTDTTTVTRKVIDQELRGHGQGTAEGMVVDFEIPISAHAGAPTFRLPNNEVSWSIKVEVDGQRLPRDSHTFEIDVAAVLDAAYRPGLQDT